MCVSTFRLHFRYCVLSDIRWNSTSHFNILTNWKYHYHRTHNHYIETVVSNQWSADHQWSAEAWIWSANDFNFRTRYGEVKFLFNYHSYTYMHSSLCYQEWYKSSPWSGKGWEPLHWKVHVVKLSSIVWNYSLICIESLEDIIIVCYLRHNILDLFLIISH